MEPQPTFLSRISTSLAASQVIDLSVTLDVTLARGACVTLDQAPPPSLLSCGAVRRQPRG